MSGQISKDKIIKAVLRGIEKAQKDYEKWSYDEWLFNAPEALMNVCIANEIMKIKGPKFLTLEDNVRDTLKSAGLVGKGKLHSEIRQNGRFDLLLWWGKGDPRAMIEVKKQVDGIEKIKGDILRIKRILARVKPQKSSLEFGIVAYYTSCNSKRNNAKENLEKRIDKIYEYAKKPLNKKTYKVESHKSIKAIKGNSDAWAAVVLYIGFNTNQNP